MKPSSRSLIAAIAHGIEEDVLPELDASSWTASRLRSCLVLLRHLEERVPTEGPLLFRENGELRELLAGLVEGLRDHPRAARLASELASVSSLPVTTPDYPSVDELATIHDACQRLLDAVVRLLHDDGEILGEARSAELNRRILDYLRRSQNRTAPMFDAAGRYSPI